MTCCHRRGRLWASRSRIFPSWFLRIEFAYRNKTPWINQTPMLRASIA
jgi:hypothetical protein